MMDAPHPEVLKSLDPVEREEFIEWLHESRADDVRKAAHDAMKKYVQRATAGFLILVLGIIAAFYVAREDTSAARAEALAQVKKDSDRQFKTIVNSGNAVAVIGCNRDYETRVQFRKLIVRAKATLGANLTRGDISQQQYDEAIQFYDDVLEENPLLDCRPAENSVTVDPDRNVVVPRPFYPGFRNDKNRG